MDEKASLFFCITLKKAKFYLELQYSGLVSGSPKIGEQIGHNFTSVSELKE